MTVRHDDGDPTRGRAGNPGATPERAFRNEMVVVVGFGIATALTGLFTMGLIEFAQAMGWWDQAGR